MSGFVAVNGHVYPADQALIPAFDRAFLFGDGVYEIIAAVGPRLLDFEAHMDRLRRSSQALHIGFPWTDAELRFEIDHLLSLSQFPRSVIRVLISRGLGAAPRLTGREQAQRYLFCMQDQSQGPQEFEKGLKLRTHRHPAPRPGEHVKSPAYLDAIVAHIEAKKDGFDDVLWLNREGELTEASFANVFLLAREGDLLEIATPPVAAGLLPGITRHRLIDLLNRSRIPVTERSIALEELPRFDEGFVCSSIRGLVPVQSIDRHRLHSTRPQASFRQILRLYQAWEQAGEEKIVPQGEVH
jgi:branched-subunit amino acid aminotransferase/4-amino-4-deoxychorismate lyase